MQSFPSPRQASLATGVRLAVYEQGAGLPVVLCHGFPELAFSWRYQLPALAENGFRAIAPDMRGFGASDVPKEVEQYTLTVLCGDLVALLDALELERAIFVGHDWGGFVAWAMPVLYPERCAGIVGVCTPYVPFPDYNRILPLVGGDPHRFYVAWFQRGGEPERHLDPRARRVFEQLLRVTGDPGESIRRRTRADGTIDLNPFLALDSLGGDRPLLVTQAELDVYVRAFERSGFFGGISWYRNIDRNRVEHPGIGVDVLDLPCLQICAEWDVAIPPSMADPMRETCADLELHVIPRAGHWVQQEYPVQVNVLMLDWLARRFS